jgi:subtilisin family serine protease
VDYVYHYEVFNRNVMNGVLVQDPVVEKQADPEPLAHQRSLDHKAAIDKRDRQRSMYWELSQISTPNRGDWYGDQRIRIPGQSPNGDRYNYYYDGSSGEGQYVYLVEDAIWENHPEFQGAFIEHRPGADYADEDHVPIILHGSAVGSKVVGKNLGIAKDATLVVLDKKTKQSSFSSFNGETIVREKMLESLLNAADDIAAKGRAGKSVVNMSFGAKRTEAPQQLWDMMRKYCPLYSLFLNPANAETLTTRDALSCIICSRYPSRTRQS